MTNRLLTMLMVAACFAAGGCTTLTDYGSMRKESLRNDQGHVIGYKEMLRNDRTGEVIAGVAVCAAGRPFRRGHRYERQARKHNHPRSTAAASAARADPSATGAQRRDKGIPSSCARPTRRRSRRRNRRSGS